MTQEIIASLDTETTGFLMPDHRLVEIYIDLSRDGRSIFTYDQRIDPQRSIPIEAQRVHKISASDLMGKPKWETVGPIVHKILTKADRYVAHNAEFDIGFLKQEFARINLELPVRPITCTMEGAIWACPNGKKPSLKELCFTCGVEYDPSVAHAASYDVIKMRECYLIAKKWGYFGVEQVEQASEAA